MSQATITIDTVIEYNDILKVAQECSDVMMELPENKVLITYRHYYFNTSNVIGDLDRQSYDEYQIYAIVNMMLIDDRILQQGELKPGDCEAFFKPSINFDYNDTPLTIPFEPQIDDEFWFNGIRFRIKLIRNEYIGNTKVFLDCLCSRMENTNPETEWNDNYRVPEEVGRAGSGWD